MDNDLYSTKSLKIIRDLLPNCIEHSDGQVQIKSQFIANICEHFRDQFRSLSTSFRNPESPDEEEQICFEFSWFYNQLLYISMHDKNSTILNDQFRKVLNFMMRESMRLCPKWLHQFLQHQFKIFDMYNSYGIDQKEIEIPFEFSGKDPNFPFSPILLTTRNDLDFIATLLLDVLATQLELYSTSILVTCNTPFPQLIGTVFKHSGIITKTSVLNVISIYFAVHQHNDTIPILIEIMESFASFCEILPIFFNNDPTDYIYYERHFTPAFIKFSESLLSTRHWHCQFKSKQEQKLFVAVMFDVIFNEQLMAKQQSVQSMITLLVNIFDFVMYRADIDEDIIFDGMTALFARMGYETSEIFPLLKYEIVLEFEKANNYSCKAIEMSECFKKIYGRLLAKLQEPHERDMNKFYCFIEFVTNTLNMAVQTADLFTRRHQMSHFKRQNNCTRCMETDDEWNYQTIDLDFLVDTQAIVHEIINRVKDADIGEQSMDMLTDLFITVFHLSYRNSNLTNDQKLYMLYVIFLPFLSMLSRSPEDNLPRNIIKYLESLTEDQVKRMKIKILMKINFLKLSKLGHEAKAFAIELTEVMFLMEADEVTEEFIARFGNYLISNSDIMEQLFQASSNSQLNCKSALCLQDKTAVIIKQTTPPNFGCLPDYAQFCKLCDSKLFANSKSEMEHYATCMNQSHGHLIFLDHYDVKKKVEIDFKQILYAPKVEENILNSLKTFIIHSANFPKIIKLEDGDKLLNFILNEENLLHMENCFDVIIKRIINSNDVTQEDKAQFFMKLFEEISLRALNASRFCQYPLIQKAYARMIATYGQNAKDIPLDDKILIKEEVIVMKCLTSLMCFMFGDQTLIKGVAIEIALKMFSDTNMKFDELIHWQQSLLMEDMCSFCLIETIQTDEAFSEVMSNFLSSLGYLKYDKFMSRNAAEILAKIFPYCVDNDQMEHIYNLASFVEDEVSIIIAKDPFKLYKKIMQLSEDGGEKVRLKYYEAIEELTGTDFMEFLKAKKILCLQSAAIYYSTDDNNFRDAVAVLFQNANQRPDWDVIIKFVTEHFLGILQYVSNVLMKDHVDRTFKQMALKSIGKLLRFIGDAQTSEFCFKVMGLLKSTATMGINWSFKKNYIETWQILIKLCNPEAYKPFLSVIFVALEPYIKDFEKEVQVIADTILVQNQYIMGRNISDLFFIDKTSYPERMKYSIDDQLHSQCITDEVSFETNLMRLVRHMQSGNADSDVKNYCLQYLHDYTKVNREALNKIILDQNKKNEEVTIGEILNILLDCCRKKSNKALLVQTAICFGEIGAITPFEMQTDNEDSTNKIGFDVHSDKFAYHVLNLICMDYKDLQNPDYIDYCGLGIQGVLNERQMTLSHPLFKKLSTVNQLLVRPFLGSRFSKKDAPVEKYEQIFWYQAQSVNDFAESLGTYLIGRIEPSTARDVLKCLIGCIRSSTEIASFVLPYILLNYYQITYHGSEEMIEDVYNIDENIKEEIAYIFSVIENENDFRHRKDQKEFENKIMADKYFVPNKTVTTEHQSTNEFIAVAKQIAKLIFEVFDFLSRYQIKTKDRNERIQKLLNSMNPKTMARVSFNCGDYERALILFETHLKNLTEDQRESEWAFLIHIYAKLGDFDSIPGVVDRRKLPWSATERMFISNATGFWESRSKLHGCIEDIMQNPESITTNVIHSTVKSLVAYNSCEESIVVADEMLKVLYDKCRDDIKEYEHVKTEALLRMSKFDELEKITKNKIGSDWSQVQANLFIKLHSGSFDLFNEEIKRVRLSIMENFKIFDSNKSIYSMNYNLVVQLHMLTDIEKANLTIQQMKGDKRKCASSVKTFFDEINARKKLFKLTPMQSESLLAIHRTLYKEVKQTVQKLAPQQSKIILKSIDHEIGNSLLECTSILQNECVDNAILFLSEAEKFEPPGLFIQQAKMQWKTFKRAEQATKILQMNCDALEKLPKYKDNEFYAKGLLLIARYNAEAANTDPNTNKIMYKKAMATSVDQHKAYLYYGEYLDRIIALKHSMEGREMDISKVRMEDLEDLLIAYGNCLKYSTEYVYQALPRFLQIWLDGTTRAKDKSGPLNKLVKTYIDQLPTYQFYTAFSQLMARICHPCEQTYSNLKIILVKLFAAFPHQSLWYMVQSLKSKIKLSSTRIQDILRQATRGRGEKEDFDYFISQLMEIAKTSHSMALAKYPDQISKALSRVRSRILMPLQQNMQILNKAMMNNLTDDDQIFICKMNEKITIMRSLQKPKKISFLCSDGLHHDLLLKEKDDLRIDFRFMEFCKVLNDYFRKDRDASLRFFSLRTYYVSPITEEIGIIEWLDNVDTLKNVIYNQYILCNNPLPVKDVHESLHKKFSALKNVKDKVELLERLIAQYPPVLGRWYEVTFSNSQSYYNARQQYIKSVAVNSVVGYIFGLGDRHLENILIDQTTGQIAHVDFNMIFNKNETLNVPETVPFRLTQNMVQAMGVLGTEGSFRKCCEITMRLLQHRKNVLISYLRPFVFDALSHNSRSEEPINQESLAAINNIKKKLDGLPRKYKKFLDIPLSSEGHVKFIIQEAMSSENLSVMYYPWGPHI